MNIRDKHFKNVICLTTVDGNEEARQGHITSDVLKRRTKEGDLVLFAYGGKKKARLAECRSRKILDSDLFMDLELTCTEGYILLAQKTYELIDFCFKNLSFDRLYKGDDTKQITEEFCDFNHKYDVDFLGVSERRRRIKRPDGGTYWDRHFKAQEMYNCRRATFEKWASRRGIKVNADFFDSTIWYSGWKPYALSRNFAEAVSSHGSRYAKLYCDHLGGCEDHMIGKIYRDMQITYNLKML